MKRDLLNFMMTVLLLITMNVRFTGNEAHEFAGVLLGALFFFHNVWNRRWYGNWRKPYTALRPYALRAVNCLLLVAAVTVLASGAAISQTVFAPLEPRSGFLAYDVHRGAAYSGFLLLAVHAGFHGEMLARRLRLWADARRISPAIRIVCRTAVVLFMCYGVYASFAQSIGSKLLLERSSAWSAAPSPFDFTLDYAAIMTLYAGAAHYAPRCAAFAARVWKAERGAWH